MSSPEKILIVDDDNLVLFCFERLLGRRFNVETALGSKQALEWITARGPYAVVLSDLRMPGMTGIELLTRAKELSPATVGILLTGNADIDETKMITNNVVVFKVLEKPCQQDELIEVLQEALALHHENLQLQSQ